MVIPFLAGIWAFFMKGVARRKIRRRIFVSVSFLHLAATIALFFFNDPLAIGGFIFLDPIGRYFLAVTSFIFALTAVYSLGYFPLKRPMAENEAGGHIYVGCMLFFLAAMSLACGTTHIGMLWVAIEATTLASAPLIYYRQSKASLEAAWKYLLICSVGIAVALLGVFFVAAASRGSVTDLLVSELTQHAQMFDKGLLRIGFILVLIGFGTKVGLAPLHSWLPDAHSEAPSPVSVLLSATLLNCALLGIIRFVTILNAAGLTAFTGTLLTIFGVASLFVAAVFITRQKDYKRLLAYSSIEHMGIVVLGLGVGATYGAFLHVAAHSLTKALLFMVAGNILVLYRTKLVSDVGGLLRTSPKSGILFAIGSMAIAGMPPALTFMSEFIILRDGFANGHVVPIVFYIVALTVIFISMTKITFKMIFGPRRELIWGDLPANMTNPPALLAGIVTAFGVYLPPQLSSVVHSVARMFV